MRYGSRLARQGRSRWYARNHRSRSIWKFPNARPVGWVFMRSVFSHFLEYGASDVDMQSSERRIRREKPPDKKSLKCYSELRKRKYEDDHSAVGIVFCGRAVRMILKISWSEASSSRNAPPMEDSSDWIFASSRRAS